jgi:LPXTG-motif cell wall-anchored protein
MRNIFTVCFFIAQCSILSANSKIDSIKSSWDSLDKIHNHLKDQSQDLEKKIAEAAEKIEAAKKKNTNYWIPILGGAILGIGLAVWLKRRK